MRHKGRVEDWDDERGFGFIEPLLGGERVFVHISAFDRRGRRPRSGDLVVYRVGHDDRGRPRAMSVKPAGVIRRRPRLPRRGHGAAVIVIAFAAAVVTAALVHRLPWAVVGAYVLLSTVTFAVYARDKSAAVNDRWRTSEAALHLLALFGGWPGALLGQRYLRHKSRKRAFQVVFWVTVLLNGAALYAIVTAPGWAQSATWPVSWPR